MNKIPRFVCGLLALAIMFFSSQTKANIPGGGTNGESVTYTDNGNGTVTIANGIVSIVVTEADASVHTINYTFNNTGSSQTLNLLTGGTDGGQLYWTGNPASFGTMSFTESVVANTTNYVEIALLSTSTTNGTMEVHYSMLRGSPGFYTSVILNHRVQDADVGIVLRPNIYAGSIFNWMSVDAARNRLMEVSGGLSIPVQGAPKEVYLWTNGIYAGRYDDKYKYSAEIGAQRAWGWSSVGTGGKNIGIWNISASVEDYPGGPMNRSLMEHIGTTILNVFTGGYYGFSTDNNIQSGELWSKTYGPYFYYCNAVTNTLTGTNAPAQALYSDALAQAAAEATAWPYSWFTNSNYTPAANRGTVTGKIIINDSGNPNASAAGLWVGLVQQPSTVYDTVYDFQQWCRPYEFWVQTDTNGNFSVPNVIAGTNYTLYAFGPGSPDTFMSQNQSGGNPPILVDVPANAFGVTVTAGATNSLGTVTWTPNRVGATVFEIGYPDRTAKKFRHGDDYWVGDIGPSPTAPSPVWSKWLEYPFDFPNRVNYVVGQNRWTTDWNFIQPVTTDSQGNYNPSSSTITFNLATTPTNGATASFYLGLCSDYYSAVIITVNGVNISGINGLVASPNSSVPSTGYYAAYASSDSNIREGNDGAFTDERLTFPASALRAGVNTINISFREIAANYFADHLMYDYLRLELTGYVPPAPANAISYAGNNCNLVTWPAVPGATSYNVLRSSTSGSGYASITNGVTGPVCGSGFDNASYLDTTAVNGSTYYYVVRSVNPTGSSTNSTQSAPATPSPSISINVPAAPTGLSVTGIGHQSVTLNWSAVSGANYYSVWRSTLMDNGGGGSNILSTIILNNTNTTTTYTDTTPTDGSIYTYNVTATSAAGTGGNSATVAAIALPATPVAVPASLTGSFVQTTNITLNWTAVPGATGYAIYRATSSGGAYTYLQSVTETTYTDIGLNPAIIYYYRVVALNVAGISANAIDLVNSQQTFPASLSAVGTNAQIILTWPATTGATSYNVVRGLSSGNEITTVVTGYTGTTYTNTGLANGTTYYYVVTATGSGGTSGNSPEASATPFATSSGIWTSTASGLWSAATNWSGGGIANGSGSVADFSTLSLPENLTVTIDSPRTISGLKFGDTTATYNWSLAGTNLLTFGSSPNINVANQTATISTPVAGTAGLSKNGAGTLILNGPTNSFTGGAVVTAGNLTLDFSATNAPAANLISSSNILTLGGGTLQINGNSNAASSQAFASTTLNPGNSVIVAAPVSGSMVPVVTLAATTANTGGTVEFIGPVTVGGGGTNVAATAVITSSASGMSAFIGGNGTAFFDANYATVGLYDFAAAGTTTPFTVVGGSQVSGFYTTASGTAAASGNLDVIGNITGYSSQPYVTSLRFNTSSGQNLTFAAYGGVLTLSDILVTPNVGNYNVTFPSGSIRPAGGSSSYAGPFVVWQNNLSGELVFTGTIGNSKVGTAAYVQSGPGTVWINNTASGYTGVSYLNGGITLINGNGALGSAATAATLNLNGGTLMANNTFALDNSGSTPRPITLLGNGGGLAAAAGTTLTVDGTISSDSGTGPLIIGLPSGGLLSGTGAGTANTAPVYATGTVMLNGSGNSFYGGVFITGGATLNINSTWQLGGANYSGGLTFNNGTLQYNATLLNSATDISQNTANPATAQTVALAGNATIDVNGNTITFENSIGNNGGGALTVKSSLTNGVLILQGANTYRGNTTVTNVTLLVNNASDSGTGSGNVSVQNGGILTGTGSLSGSVTVATGGTLAPGNPLGNLTIGGNLTLATGSTTLLQIQHSPLTNDAVIIAGTLNAGGTLIVTNTGGALANGDTFNLFSAGGYSGSFAAIVLPPLSGNLLWNTNALTADGTLSVVVPTPPMISEIQATDGSLLINGNGGTPYWNYYLLVATNLAVTPVNWTPLLTNQFDAAGNFNLTLTNGISPVQPQMFYKLQLQ